MTPATRELLSYTPLADQPEDALQPQGYLRVSLDAEHRPKLEAWLRLHLEQMEAALADVHARFEEERNQLEGNMPGGDYPYPGAFRLNVPVTKKKVREIANRMKQAYLDSDPIWAVTSPTLPTEITQGVERGLDHQMDHALEAADDLSQSLFEAVLHGVGALEPAWAYQEDVRRDVERLTGWNGMDLESLKDLATFEQTYPDWRDSKPAKELHSKLAKGQDVEVEVSYRTATVNRPSLTHIPAKDVRAYPSLNSWDALQGSPVYGYVKTHTRLELEAFAEDGTIDDDQLGRVFGDTPDNTQDARSAEDDFEILKATIRYQLPGDEQPTRYKAWFERESGAILRLRHFPWWLDAPDLILFHTRQEEPGIFKRGIAWDLKDTHLATNVTFSLFLNGADMANSMRWLVKENSLAEQHLLQRRWSPHLPMRYRQDPKEVQSLATPTSHLGPLVNGFELMRRQADEETQTSSLQSGRESPTDPSAPAAKTAMLLQQVEPNMKECLRSLEPGFRQLGKWVLWMLYQGKRLGWITELSGFPEMPDELLPQLASQLAPRALLFESDRESRLQANNLVLGWVTKLAPQAVPQVLKIAISQTNSQWAREVDSLNLEPPMPMGPPGAATPGAMAGLGGMVADDGRPGPTA